MENNFNHNPFWSFALLILLLNSTIIIPLHHQTMKSSKLCRFHQISSLGQISDTSEAGHNFCCIFRVKTTFSNFSSIVLTRPQPGHTAIDVPELKMVSEDYCPQNPAWRQAREVMSHYNLMRTLVEKEENHYCHYLLTHKTGKTSEINQFF